MRNVKTTQHFEDRLYDYFGDGLFPELDKYSDLELAEAILESTFEVVLVSGEKYREVTVAGVNYGIGYDMGTDGTVIAKTVIHPMDVEDNRCRSFKATRKTVEKF